MQTGQQPRFKAVFNGENLGWFDTIEEAQEAIDSAKNEEKNEDSEFLKWLEK